MTQAAEGAEIGAAPVGDKVVALNWTTTNREPDSNEPPKDVRFAKENRARSACFRECLWGPSSTTMKSARYAWRSSWMRTRSLLCPVIDAITSTLIASNRGSGGKTTARCARRRSRLNSSRRSWREGSPRLELFRVVASDRMIAGLKRKGFPRSNIVAWKGKKDKNKKLQSSTALLTTKLPSLLYDICSWLLKLTMLWVHL